MGNGSIAAIAAWRHDRGKRVEVEFDDLAQSFGGGTVAEAVAQCLVPAGILGLQREQLGDGGPPALRSGAAIRRPAVSDHRGWLLSLVAGTVACLALSVAEGMLAFRLATSLACSILRYITEFCRTIRRLVWRDGASGRRWLQHSLAPGGVACPSFDIAEAVLVLRSAASRHALFTVT